MKFVKVGFLSMMMLSLLVFAGCGSSTGPLTEEEQASKYGYTLEQYRENKQAAARMNMTIEEHAKMLKEDQDEENMDMDM